MALPDEASLLAAAFSEFIAAAARLEASYAELQGQVAQLGLELAERNAALNASLAENERMRLALQQIVDSMPCGVLVLENDGSLSMINPEGLRLLGIEPRDRHDCGLEGRDGLDREKASAGETIRNRRSADPAVIRTPATLDEVSRRAGIDLAPFIENERIAEGEQEFSLAGAGGKRWIEVRNRRLYAHADEKPRGERWRQTILILRDVTAHKQAEQERERGRRATALAEVAAMLAHEIRNPLASLELFAGLIAESPSVAQSEGGELEWISHMRAGIRSLSGTVNNVLSFHGVGFPALAPLPLAEAIRSSVEFVRPIANAAGVALCFRADNFEASVLGNASALQQLVLNLVANAVRSTPKGGRVAVTVRSAARDKAKAPGVEIEFADTGCGIRAEHLDEIFRAGFSASGNTSGLGLAVCRQIVTQHGGRIEVASTHELRAGAGVSGTVFRVELPTL